MRLVSTVSFSILFNGVKSEKFAPSRGLRQGDPISPYLFLLAAEGLSSLIKDRCESSALQGVKVAESAPAISHLLFADDCLLFFKANLESVNHIRDVLELYCNASGQRVNLDKSSIFFSKGCSEALRHDIKDWLDVHQETLNEKYLGMPIDVGRDKNGKLQFLKDRIWKWVQGWFEKTLSAAAKDVLIKSVAQAIPTYSMSCFRLPRGLCQEINSILRKFWWGCKAGERKACWVAWSDMTKPRYMGGLGFRDIELFNLALLARQAWRVLQSPDSLSARILKARYFPATEFLQADLGSRPSQVWRAILDGRDTLKQGIIKRIGTGEATDPWNDNWLPRDGRLRPIACLAAHAPSRVSEFIDRTSATWNCEKLKECFLPMDVEAILNLPLSTRNQQDEWAWHYDRKGVFTVRSAYKMLVHTKTTREAWLGGSAASSDTKKVEKQ